LVLGVGAWCWCLVLVLCVGTLCWCLVLVRFRIMHPHPLRQKKPSNIAVSNFFSLLICLYLKPIFRYRQTKCSLPLFDVLLYQELHLPLVSPLSIPPSPYAISWSYGIDMGEMLLASLAGLGATAYFSASPKMHCQVGIN
jgi:hypothetical protein